MRKAYDFSKMKGRRNPYAKRKSNKALPHFPIGKLTRIKDVLPQQKKLIVTEK